MTFHRLDHNIDPGSSGTLHGLVDFSLQHLYFTACPKGNSRLPFEEQKQLHPCPCNPKMNCQSYYYNFGSKLAPTKGQSK
eukprot:5864302-Amphidinium_carterae.1